MGRRSSNERFPRDDPGESAQALGFGDDLNGGWHVFTLEDLRRRRTADGKRLLPQTNAALIREIQRQFPDWKPNQ